METNEKIKSEYFVIDFAHILKTLLNRAWLIIVSSILAAIIGLFVSAVVIAPKYSSSVKLYVNNRSLSTGELSISSSEISAAQSLVKTYSVILKNRTTLERVIAETGVKYTWEELYNMIKAEPVNGTEVMDVTVTCKSAEQAKIIANGIAEVLPERIAEIVEGSTVEVVDSAVINSEKVSPSITKFTAVGLVLGAFVSVLFVIILALADNTIHDEEYIIKTYDFPILAKIPNLLDAGDKRYGYYKSSSSSKTAERGE